MNEGIGELKCRRHFVLIWNRWATTSKWAKTLPCAHLAERTAESCAAIWERNIPWKASAGRYWHRAILKGHTGRSHSGADFTVIWSKPEKWQVFAPSIFITAICWAYFLKSKTGSPGKHEILVGSCRVKIKPIKTADSCSAEYINVFNPSILISQGINVGSEIEFERNSGAVNILLYGKRLDSF